MVVSNVFADTTAEKEAKRIRSKERMYRRFGVFCVFAALMIVLAGQCFASDEIRGKCVYQTASGEDIVFIKGGEGIETKIMELAQGKPVFYKCEVLTANGIQFVRGKSRGGK